MCVNSLKRAGFQADYLTGEVSSNKRKDIVYNFRKGFQQKILCVQGKCASYGLDLSVASTSIYYSNWYDGELRAQSEDRIIHPSKNEPVLFLDLITKNSIDEHVIRLLLKKKLNSKLFLEKLNQRLKEEISNVKERKRKFT